MNFSRLLLLLVSCLLCTALPGCRTTKPRTADSFPGPYQREENLLREATLDELYDLLGYRTPEHPLLWSRGTVRIRQQGVKGTMWFDATLIYRDPDAVRLRGSRVGLGTLFEVIVSGDNAWVHLNRDKELYGGTLEELRREGGLLGSFTLRDMIAAVLVNHDLRERLAVPRRWRVSRDAEEMRLVLVREDGGRITWHVRRLDGLVREIVLRDRWNREELRVTYRGYQLVEGEPLPSKLMLSMWEGEVTVEIDLAEYKLRPDMKPENVDFLPALETWPLAALNSREPVIPIEEEEAPAGTVP